MGARGWLRAGFAGREQLPGVYRQGPGLLLRWPLPRPGPRVYFAPERGLPRVRVSRSQLESGEGTAPCPLHDHLPRVNRLLSPPPLALRALCALCHRTGGFSLLSQ